jgi:hypothetical protein
MTPVALLAIDLDGTLLNSEGFISPANCAAIQQAYRRGIRIILATTRNLDSVRAFCQALAINDPVICANGALILEAPFGSIWVFRTIPQEIAQEIARTADNCDWELSITIGEITYLRQRPGQPLGPLSPTSVIVARNGDGIVGTPLRILTWNPEAIEQIRALCQAQFAHACQTETFYKADGRVHSLGIFPHGADKGQALAFVLDKLGIEPTQVMAIGDNNNDLALFTQASIKVAMENGTAALKQQATLIAPTNDEDGVAWAIERVLFAANALPTTW